MPSISPSKASSRIAIKTASSQILPMRSPAVAPSSASSFEATSTPKRASQPQSAASLEIEHRALVSQARRAAIRKMLSRIDEIEVPVCGDTAGNGHQDHAVLLLQRLRDLGFRGSLNVMADPGATAKMHRLMREDPTTANLDVRFYWGAPPEPDSRIKRLVLSPSDDKAVYFPDFSARSVAYLSFHPPGWAMFEGSHRVRAPQGEAFEEPEWMSAPVHRRVPTRTELIAAIDAMPNAPRSLELVAKGSLDSATDAVISIYPYNAKHSAVAPHEGIARAVEAASSVRGGKRLVIPVIGTDARTWCEQAAAVLAKRGCVATVAEENGETGALPQQPVVLVPLGELPRTVFSGLMAHSKLGVCEGQNTKALLVAAGTPQLSYVEERTPLSTEVTGELRSLHDQANRALQASEGSDRQRLLQFLSKTLAVETAPYFEARRDEWLERPDKLELMLGALAERWLLE
jgi:hypothetical protein